MKRLAIFLDGTWNTLNNNTNVWRLKSLTAETPEQRVYYSQGVGTQRGDAARGGITGYGIDDEIIEAYGPSPPSPFLSGEEPCWSLGPKDAETYCPTSLQNSFSCAAPAFFSSSIARLRSSFRNRCLSATSVSPV